MGIIHPEHERLFEESTAVDHSTSLDCLERAIEHLQPWEGTRLKFVKGQDLPKPHICMAYIPDDEAGNRL